MEQNHSLELIGGRLMKVGTSLKSIANSAATRPVLVLDNSGSMSDYISFEQVNVNADGQQNRKIDELRRLVQKLRQEADFEQLVFNTSPEFTEAIADPTGGTGLHLALKLIIAERPRTRRIVLITDGYPDNPSLALAIAKRLPCPLDVFYVGLATDIAGQAFLRNLADAAKGQYGQMDLGTGFAALQEKVRLALNPMPEKAREMGGEK